MAIDIKIIKIMYRDGNMTFNILFAYKEMKRINTQVRKRERYYNVFINYPICFDFCPVILVIFSKYVLE